MSLLRLQAAFRAELAADDDAAPPSSPGMEVYRNAYRGRLLSALEVSFARTRRWTGEDAFAAAARQYVLTRPPCSWTLDAYGGDFPGLLAGLFPADPEVAQLAAMEWAMQQAFAAPDAPPLDAQALAARHGPADWDRMGFDMAAGFAALPVDFDLPRLWVDLGEAGTATESSRQPIPRAQLLVWRVGLSPTFRLAPLDEAEALDRLARGAALGALAETCSAEALGQWLAHWFSENIFAAGRPAP